MAMRHMRSIGTIVDPIFIDTLPGAEDTLASTGTNLYALLGVGIGIVVVGVIGVGKNKSHSHVN